MQIVTRQVEGKPLTVTIEYPEYTDPVERLIRRIESLDVTFCAVSDDRQIRIAASDVYYLERVDRKLFLYTEHNVYRLDSSSSELEKLTSGSGFVRISRTCIMNTAHLTGIRQLKNSHLEASLDNGEHLIVSRKYLRDIKKCF